MELLFFKSGEKSHTSKSLKKVQKSVKMLQIDFSTDTIVFTYLQIALRDSSLISCHVSNVCMSVVQAGFLCHSFV